MNYKSKEEFRRICRTRNVDTIREVLESGKGDLSILTQIGGVSMIQELCHSKRSPELDDVLDSLFIHICATGLHQLYMPMLETGWRPVKYNVLEEAILIASYQEYDASIQPGMMDLLFSPGSVTLIGCPNLTSAKRDMAFNRVQAATLGYMHDFASALNYLGVLKFIVATPRFAEMMSACTPRAIPHTQKSELECKEFLSWAFHTSPTDIILTPEFKAFVDATWPGHVTQITDPDYLFDAASRDGPFIYFDLQPAPYTLKARSYTSPGLLDRIFTRAIVLNLVDVVNNADTLEYLLSRLPAENVLGDPVAPLIPILQRKLFRISQRSRDLIIKHPLMIPQITRRDVRCVLNDEEKMYAEQQARIRYDSELGMLLHENGLDDVASVLIGLHDGYDIAILRAIDLCLAQKDGEMLRNVIHITGISDIRQRDAEDLLPRVFRQSADIKLAWLEIRVPPSWMNYIYTILNIIAGFETILTPDMLETFVFANREALATYRYSPHRASSPVQHLLVSYGLGSHSDDHTMTIALQEKDLRRVATLLYCGYPIPADYVLADEDRATLLGKMVRTFRRRDPAYSDLMSGKAKIVFLKSTMMAFVAARQTMSFLPIEMIVSIITMLPPQSFPRDSGIPVLAPTFVNLILNEWMSNRQV